MHKLSLLRRCDARVSGEVQREHEESFQKDDSVLRLLFEFEFARWRDVAGRLSCHWGER